MFAYSWALQVLPGVTRGGEVCNMLRPGAGRNRQVVEREQWPVTGAATETRSCEMSQSRADTRSPESPGQTWSQSRASGQDGTITPSLHSRRLTRLRTHAMTSGTSTSISPRCLFSLAEAVGTSRGAQQLTSATLMTQRPRGHQGPHSVTAEAP